MDDGRDASVMFVTRRRSVSGMPPIRDYRDIVAWQRAIELAVAVRALCDKLPRTEWEIASQMRRAAISVHSNIAEGNGRGSLADYLRHLYMSRASLNELESDLYYIDRSYGSRLDTQKVLDHAIGVRKPLYGLIKKLQDKNAEQ
jgi:four helix bundle protein